MMKNPQKGFATPLVIAIIALVVIIGGVSYFTGKQQPIVKEDVMVKPDDIMMRKEGEGMMAKYTGTVLAGPSALLLDFTKADYDTAVKSDTLVVLYFYANWCPICKAEFPIMQKVFDELTTDTVIGFRVNYNDDQTDNDEKNLAKE